MNVNDVRKLSSHALEDLRRRVVAAVESGASQVEVARLFGVSRPTVNRWVQAYRVAGDESFRPRKRGRRSGERWSLTATQQAQITASITNNYPDSLGLTCLLWTRQAVVDLISQLHGIQLSLTAASTYLRRWGFTLPDPLPHALERSPAAVRDWRDNEYSAIAKTAQIDGAVIFWVTWMNLHYNTSVNSRSKKAGAEDAGVGELWEVNILSAMSNRGSLYFSAHDGPCDGEMVSEFLDRLSCQIRRPAHVIIDLFPIYHAEVLRGWLERNDHRISAHFPLSVVEELQALKSG
jgi:transposase